MNFSKDSSWLIIAAIILFFDQASKWYFVLAEPFIDLGFLRLHLVYNTGASFGILQGNNALLIFVALIVMGLFLWQYDKIDVRDRRLGLIVLAGVVGNVLDRLFHGAVVDFIDLGWFPVFNVADSAISIGALLIVCYALKDEFCKKKK